MKALRRAIIAMTGLLVYLLGCVTMTLLLPSAAAPDTRVPSPPAGVQVRVNVQTAQDVAQTRARLVEYLFGDTAPSSAVCGASTCLVEMAYGLTSSIDVRQPPTPNGDLFIYHNGHAGETPDITETIDALLNAGYTVAVMDMPLLGVNPPVTVSLPHYGTVTLHQHDHLQFMEGMVDGSPVRYFIEPVIAFLNAVDGQYAHTYMTGISGGGWTTTWAAALDTRIDASYPIAGSLPIALRFHDDASWGDYEQTIPALYAIADYADLYVLGAAERRQIQMLNDADPCCFAGDTRAFYEQAVADAAALNGGAFQVRLDHNNTHTLAPDALVQMLADVR